MHPRSWASSSPLHLLVPLNLSETKTVLSPFPAAPEARFPARSWRLRSSPVPSPGPARAGSRGGGETTGKPQGSNVREPFRSECWRLVPPQPLTVPRAHPISLSPAPEAAPRRGLREGSRGTAGSGPGGGRVQCGPSDPRASSVWSRAKAGGRGGGRGRCLSSGRRPCLSGSGARVGNDRGELGGSEAEAEGRRVGSRECVAGGSLEPVDLVRSRSADRAPARALRLTPAPPVGEGPESCCCRLGGAGVGSRRLLPGPRETRAGVMVGEPAGAPSPAPTRGRSIAAVRGAPRQGAARRGASGRRGR